jgi:RimJ/RimL family protein N-acetyltransferase
VDFQALGERLERLYSRRLALRPVCMADTWPLFQATRNPLFNAHLLWERPESADEVGDRIEAIIAADRRGELCATSAVVRDTGEWVSLFRFQKHPSRPGATELGIWTHDRFWHGRYSLELGRACVDAAFEFGGAELLVGGSSQGNRSSFELMTLCGLEPDCRVERPTESGQMAVGVEHTLSRRAWLERRKVRSFSVLESRADRLQPGLRAEAPAPLLPGMIPAHLPPDDDPRTPAIPRTEPATRTAAGTPAAG